jgi:hypothetical protein
MGLPVNLVRKVLANRTMDIPADNGLALERRMVLLVIGFENIVF